MFSYPDEFRTSLTKKGFCLQIELNNLEMKHSLGGYFARSEVIDIDEHEHTLLFIYHNYLLPFINPAYAPHHNITLNEKQPRRLH